MSSSNSLGTVLGAYITLSVADDLLYRTRRRARKRRLRRSLFNFWA